MNGPATASVTMLKPERRAPVARRQVHVAADFERVRACPGGDACRADLRRLADTSPAGPAVPRTVGRSRASPAAPSVCAPGFPGQELFAVLAAEVERERAERARLRRDGPRGEPGAQTWRRVRSLRRRRTTPAWRPACPANTLPCRKPGALHGVRSAVVVAGPHAAGVSSGARGPPFRRMRQFAERERRVLQELRRQLPGRGVRLDLPPRPSGSRRCSRAARRHPVPDRACRGCHRGRPGPCTPFRRPHRSRAARGTRAP